MIIGYIKLTCTDGKRSMDLEAAQTANFRAWRLTNAGMIACFVFAGAVLIATLAVANSANPSQAAPAISHTTLP